MSSDSLNKFHSKSVSSSLTSADDPRALVQITLNAVLAALEDGEPKVLCTQTNGTDGKILALPYGPFDPLHHRTFEIGLRDWVTRQTKASIGYVEQLYTFGDRGREAAINAHHSNRDIYKGITDESSFEQTALSHIISIGYLALAPKPAAVDVTDASWRSWYRFFPWEDWRDEEPAILAQHILPALFNWANHCEDPAKKHNRLSRIRLAFGFSDIGWEEERILDRYELMYESRLIGEAINNNIEGTTKKPDGNIVGIQMASDHRRILATAIARLRGKLKYRPIIFEMIPTEFTLLDLQKRVEAMIGFPMHKQNFRRSVENIGLVNRTGNVSNEAGGRPAALFTINREYLKDRSARGLVIPRIKRSPSYKEA